MAEISIKQQAPTPVEVERKKFDFPTEVIELPSQGLVYPEDIHLEKELVK